MVMDSAVGKGNFLRDGSNECLIQVNWMRGVDGRLGE